MSDLLEPVQVEQPLTTISESLIHGVCCLTKRGDVAFCSTRLDGPEELPKGIQVECVVCDSIEAVHPFTCPHDGTPCPHA